MDVFVWFGIVGLPGLSCHSIWSWNKHVEKIWVAYIRTHRPCLKFRAYLLQKLYAETHCSKIGVLWALGHLCTNSTVKLALCQKHCTLAKYCKQFVEPGQWSNILLPWPDFWVWRGKSAGVPNQTMALESFYGIIYTRSLSVTTGIYAGLIQPQYEERYYSTAEKWCSLNSPLFF